MDPFATIVDRAADLFCRHAFQMLVQSSLLVGVILVIDLVIRKRARAVVRYWLWMLVLVKLVLPPDLASPVSLVGWAREGGSRIREAMASLPTTHTQSAEEWHKPARPAGRPEGVEVKAVAEAHPAPRYGAGPESSASLTQSHVPAATSEAFQAPGPVHRSAQDGKILFVRRAAFVAWILGAAAFSLVLLWRLEGVRRLRARARPTADHLRWRLESACRAVRILPRRVRVRVSGEVGSPVICGAWRPTVLVPDHIVDELHPDDERAIFVHELTHLRRGDLHVSLLQAILQVVYFYNPAVWIANHYIRKLREQAVDEAALVALNKDPCDYSDMLVLIASLMPRRSPAGLGMVSVVESTSKLSQRIDHILSRPVPRSMGLGVRGLAVVGLAGAVLVPMARGSLPSLSWRFSLNSPPPAPSVVEQQERPAESILDESRARSTSRSDNSRENPLRSFFQSSYPYKRDYIEMFGLGDLPASAGFAGATPRREAPVTNWSSPAVRRSLEPNVWRISNETAALPAGSDRLSKLYFVERPAGAQQEGAILRANLHGTEVETVLTGLGNPGCLAVAGGRLYWSEQGTPCIRSVKLDGTAPALRLATLGNVHDLEVVAAPTPGVYFACSLKEGSSIFFAPTKGTPPTRVVSRTEFIRGIAVAHTLKKLYWSAAYDGKIFRSDLDGGSPEEVISARGTIWDIDYDAASDLIYWAESPGQGEPRTKAQSSRGGGVFCARPDGTNVRGLTDALAVELAIDPQSRQIYAAVGGPAGRIWRCNLDGSGAETVVEQVDMPLGLAIVHPSSLLEPDPFEKVLPATEP